MDGLQDLGKTAPVLEVHAQGSVKRGVGASGDFLGLLLEHFAAKGNTSMAVDVLASIFASKTAFPPKAAPARGESPEHPEPREEPELRRDVAREDRPEAPREPDYAQDETVCCEPPLDGPAAPPSDHRPAQKLTDKAKADSPPAESPRSTEQPTEQPAQSTERAADKSDAQQLPSQVAPEGPAKPSADSDEPPADDVAGSPAISQTPSGKLVETALPDDADEATSSDSQPAQEPKAALPSAEGATSETDQREPADVPDDEAVQHDQTLEHEPHAHADNVPRNPDQIHGGDDRAAASHSPGVTAHNAPLIDAAAADRAVSVNDAPSLAASLGTTASADAVASLEASTGADGSSSDGQQIGPRAQSTNANAQNAAAVGDGDAAERLDTVFRQVLSTSRLSQDMQQRIELARSIGQQVIRSALVNVRDGRTHVMLQLKPPSLGTVRMQLTGDGKTVSARLTVDTPLVRQAVEQHVHQLRSVLRQEGFELGRFEVSVRSQGGSTPWAFDQAEHGSGHGPRRWASTGDEAYTEQTQTPIDETAVLPAAVHDGAVDYLA